MRQTNHRYVKLLSYISYQFSCSCYLLNSKVQYWHNQLHFVLSVHTMTKIQKKENKYTMNIAEAICFYYPCFILLWFTWQIVGDVTWKNLLCNFSRLLQYLHTMYVCANKACYHCCCIPFIPLQHLTCH